VRQWIFSFWGGLLHHSVDSGFVQTAVNFFLCLMFLPFKIVAHGYLHLLSTGLNLINDACLPFETSLGDKHRPTLAPTLAEISHFPKQKTVPSVIMSQDDGFVHLDNPVI
jgi:hypothetical protein